MHWHELLDSLTTASQHQLMNALTLGCGHTVFAVRLLDEDGDSPAAAECLAVAQDALRAACRMAGVDANPGQRIPVPDPVDHGVVQRLPDRWRGFAATRDLAEARQLAGVMASAVAHARQAGVKVLDDGLVEEIRLHLIGAAAALADARRLVLAAAS